MPGEAAAAPGLSHYTRLQEIEQRVVHALEAASCVMAELSKEQEQMDKALLNEAAQGFLLQMKEAQEFVLEAIRSAAPDRKFEANNYFLMLQSMVAAEKLDAVSVHISGISSALREHMQQQQQQGGSTGATPLSGVEGGMAMDGTSEPLPDAGPAAS